MTLPYPAALGADVKLLALPLRDQFQHFLVKRGLGLCGREGEGVCEREGERVCKRERVKLCV